MICQLYINLYEREIGLRRIFAGCREVLEGVGTDGPEILKPNQIKTDFQERKLSSNAQIWRSRKQCL